MFSEFIAEKFHDPVIPGSLMDKPKRAATTDDNGGADSLVDVDLTLMQTQVPSKKSAESEVAETTSGRGRRLYCDREGKIIRSE